MTLQTIVRTKLYSLSEKWQTARYTEMELAYFC